MPSVCRILAVFASSSKTAAPAARGPGSHRASPGRTGEGGTGSQGAGFKEPRVDEPTIDAQTGIAGSVLLRFRLLGHAIPPVDQQTPQALTKHHKAELDKWWPIIKAAGIDPIWFAVLCLINLEVALLTPPFGLLLFVMKGAAPQVNIERVYLAALPFLLIDIVVIGLLIAFPEIATVFAGVVR